jgi:hypothetical protein
MVSHFPVSIGRSAFFQLRARYANTPFQVMTIEADLSIGLWSNAWPADRSQCEWHPWDRNAFPIERIGLPSRSSQLCKPMLAPSLDSEAVALFSRCRDIVYSVASPPSFAG